MLVTFPSPHPGTPTHPSTPKVLRAREHAPILYSSGVFTSNSHLFLSRSLGVCYCQKTKMTSWNQTTCFNFAFNNKATIPSAPRVVALHNATMHSATSYKEGSSQTSPSTSRDDSTSQTKVSRKFRIDGEMSLPPPKPSVKCSPKHCSMACGL
jgi:hypothetical protein